MSTMFHVVLFLFLYTLSQALIVKQPSWFSCSHVQIRVGSASTCRESSCLGFNAQGIVGNYCIITRLHKMFQHWREEPCFIPILIWTLPSNLWKKSFIQYSAVNVFYSRLNHMGQLLLYLQPILPEVAHCRATLLRFRIRRWGVP